MEGSKSTSRGLTKRNVILISLAGFILAICTCCVLIFALGLWDPLSLDPDNLEPGKSPRGTNLGMLDSTEIESATTETVTPNVSPTAEDPPMPTNTPNLNAPRTATVQALLTQAVLAQTQTETETREPPQLIIDVSTILNNNANEVEKILGSPTDVYPIDIGEELADTPGGESRTYLYNDYEVFVDYDVSGTAKLFQVLSGLTEEKYQLGDYPFILQRFGISIMSLPDITAPARYGWENYHGYTINIAKNGTTADSYVWTVQIYITP